MMFKKSLAIILTVIMLISPLQNSLAYVLTTDSVSREPSVILDNGVEDNRIAKQFTNADFELIEKSIAQDIDGIYRIIDEKALMAAFTEEQYSFIVKQIDNANCDANFQTRYPTGTESDPYILAHDVLFESYSNGASLTWFKTPSIGGATDFKVNATKNVELSIYKEVLFWKKHLLTVSGTSINKTISDISINNYYNTYFLKLSSSSAHSQGVTVKQHVDKTYTYYSGGTIWEPSDRSARANSLLLVHQLWYLKASEIGYVVAFVTSNEYYNFCDQFAAGTITIASIVASLALPATAAAKAIGCALALVGFLSSVTFRTLFMKSINSVGGWNGKYYTKNVRVATVLPLNSMSTWTLTVEPWNGSVISGEPGYTGSFRPYK